jgi:large subunit ribosomal protein L15
MKLNELADNEGSTKKLMRVGRGVGSGKGKTGGRGVKGQKSRRGVSINGFEGGQMPIHMRAPKRGFHSRNRPDHAWINLSRLQKAIDSKVLDAKTDIDEAALVAAGIIRRKKDGVRLLAKGDLKAKVNITVTGASAAAIAAVEKAGGKVTVLKPVEAEDATAA